MTIRVCSFDFDGCLFNENYIYDRDRPTGQSRVIYYNKAFLNKLKEESDQFQKTITFIGSNRQSKPIDDFNFQVQGPWGLTFTKGSCFPAIQEVTDYLITSNEHPVIFEPMLMADIYGELKQGVSYYRGLSKHYDGKHANWRFDENKLSILYAQMHKVASEHPEETIQFDFYDDKYSIFSGLMAYFEKNKKTVPHNLTLNLYQYNGKQVDPTLKARYVGEGEIDTEYRQTIKAMGDHVSSVQHEEGYISKALYFDRVLNDDELIKLRAVNVSQSMPALTPLEKVLEKEHAQTIAKQAIRCHLIDKIRALKGGPIKALTELVFTEESEKGVHKHFIQEINAALNLFEEITSPGLRDVNSFKQSCVKAIDKADVHLRYDNNWRPLIKNLLLCLTGIGILFSVFSCVERQRHGRYAFFDNTVSHSTLMTEKDQINSFDFCHR